MPPRLIRTPVAVKKIVRARTVEHDVPIVDGTETLLDLPVRRPLARAEIVEIADAVVRDVERAAAGDR